MIIYLFFKPLDIKQQTFTDIPMFEISSFTLYEIDINSLSTVMKGEKAIRYSDRYLISNINYTDNSEKYIANMRANKAVYKNEIIDLNGDVRYDREDGLAFKSQTLRYNKKTNITTTDKEFVLYKSKNSITGTSLRYNNVSNNAAANNVIVKYQLKEVK